MRDRPSQRQWDVFCRVIDNFGDIGVSWRLCADLADRGERVRLWVDDPSALAWMAPQGAAGVELVRWTDPAPDHAPGDVVVETFGCDPPAAFVERMRARPPVWINLEYLSAEDYVERSHRLPSPRAGMTKWFFYPGFTAGTGGLLREPGLTAAREGFDRLRWLATQGIDVSPGERLVSLFAYPQAPFDALFERLAELPTLLLLCAGAGQAPALACLPGTGRRGRLRVRPLPLLTQPDYDRLLWSCDLNLARGEDSIVRAMWAGAPFVWHIYPQKDGAHAVKLEALLRRMQAPADVAATWRAWNGLGPWPTALPDPAGWQAAALRWRADLVAQQDLVTQLIGWVDEKR